MKRINLLPEDVLRRREERHAARRRMTICAIGAVAMTAWFGAAAMQIASLNQRIHQAERELAPVRESHARYEALLQERRVLESQVAVLQALDEPLAPKAVLALLSQLTPERVELYNLLVELPETRIVQDAGAGPHPASLYIRLEGFAPDDTDIALLMRQLSESDVFQDIRLLDSREADVDDRPMHSFHATARIPLHTHAVPLHQSLAGIDER